MEPFTVYKFAVKVCPRCGADHGKMTFEEIGNTVIVDLESGQAHSYDFQTMCPTANKPVFASVEEHRLEGTNVVSQN